MPISTLPKWHIPRIWGRCLQIFETSQNPQLYRISNEIWYSFWPYCVYFYGSAHYSRFEVHLFINRQNFGFWNSFLAKIIADKESLEHGPFSTFCLIWSTLLVRKIGKKSKLLILDTFGYKTNFQWSGWFWTMCSCQFFKCN